jgi:hypothetical protein
VTAGCCCRPETVLRRQGKSLLYCPRQLHGGGTVLGRWDAGCVAAPFPSDTSLDAPCHLSTVLPFGPSAAALRAKGVAIDAAGARKRVKRLTALIDGLTKEEEAMQASLGVLTREEWTEYLTAIWSAKEALEDARTALQMAARRR